MPVHNSIYNQHAHILLSWQTTRKILRSENINKNCFWIFFLISSRLFKMTFKINHTIFEVAKFREPKDKECKLDSCLQEKEWKLEAMEAARLSLILQANLVEMLSCLWVHIHVPAVFCLGVWAGSKLIEVSVLVELGSCWRGSNPSCSIWTGSENNLIVFSAQDNSKGCSFLLDNIEWMTYNWKSS